MNNNSKEVNKIKTVLFKIQKKCSNTYVYMHKHDLTKLCFHVIYTTNTEYFYMAIIPLHNLVKLSY